MSIVSVRIKRYPNFDGIFGRHHFDILPKWASAKKRYELFNCNALCRCVCKPEASYKHVKTSRFGAKSQSSICPSREPLSSKRKQQRIWRNFFGTHWLQILACSKDTLQSTVSRDSLRLFMTPHRIKRLTKFSKSCSASPFHSLFLPVNTSKFFICIFENNALRFVCQRVCNTSRNASCLPEW
jgi:hypothetical protein